MNPLGHTDIARHREHRLLRLCVHHFTAAATCSTTFGFPLLSGVTFSITLSACVQNTRGDIVTILVHFSIARCTYICNSTAKGPSLSRPVGVFWSFTKMFEPKTVREMVSPMLIANAIVGMGNWSTNRGRFLNIAYSLICLVTYCVVMKLSIQYLGTYYLPKMNSLGNYTFHGIFYANICLTVCLIPCGWLRRKVI